MYYAHEWLELICWLQVRPGEMPTVLPPTDFVMISETSNAMSQLDCLRLTGGGYTACDGLPLYIWIRGNDKFCHLQRHHEIGNTSMRTSEAKQVIKLMNYAMMTTWQPVILSTGENGNIQNTTGPFYGNSLTPCTIWPSNVLYFLYGFWTTSKKPTVVVVTDSWRFTRNKKGRRRGPTNNLLSEARPKSDRLLLLIPASSDIRSHILVGAARQRDWAIGECSEDCRVYSLLSLS